MTGSYNQISFFLKKKKVVTGKTQLFVIGTFHTFCIFHSIFLTTGF